jgi:hypothetical protein
MPDDQSYSHEKQPPEERISGDASYSQEQDFLQKILSESLSIGASEGGDPKDLNAIMQVAEDYRNCPLTTDPIAIELVQALLQEKFPSLPINATQWEEASREIAVALMEDPASRDRLTMLWAQISRSPS